MRQPENGSMGKVKVEIMVANNQDIQGVVLGAVAPDKVRFARLEATVDTAATHLVLPETVANQLGLPKEGERPVTYADRRSVIRTIVDQARVELMGRRGTYKAIVEPDRTTALLGAIVLEDLDFLVDPKKETIFPRDPQGAVYEVE